MFSFWYVLILTLNTQTILIINAYLCVNNFEILTRNALISHLNSRCDQKILDEDPFHTILNKNVSFSSQGSIFTLLDRGRVFFHMSVFIFTGRVFYSQRSRLF